MRGATKKKLVQHIEKKACLAQHMRFGKRREKAALGKSERNIIIIIIFIIFFWARLPSGSREFFFFFFFDHAIRNFRIMGGDGEIIGVNSNNHNNK